MKFVIILVVLCGLTTYSTQCPTSTKMECVNSYDTLTMRKDWPIRKLIPEMVEKYDLCRNITRYIYCINTKCMAKDIDLVHEIGGILIHCSNANRKKPKGPLCEEMKIVCYAAIAKIARVAVDANSLFTKNLIRNHHLCGAVKVIGYCLLNDCIESEEDKRGVISAAWAFCHDDGQLLKAEPASSATSLTAPVALVITAAMTITSRYRGQ